MQLTWNSQTQLHSLTDKRKCVKQEVIAILVKGSKFWIGSNWCENPQTVCPRVVYKLPTGVGYGLCKDLCKQKHHAELDALHKAGAHAKGAELYLTGHSYICKGCLKNLQKSGVSSVHIGDIPANILTGRQHGFKKKKA